ncbi:MAG: ABC transporter substrate-binding protein [Verrucomicrobia subdivision 3 bacterium]|nr:ABC transporter substrate-binding protein [Limisphaerales bacterium]
MSKGPSGAFTVSQKTAPLRIGFAPVNDCAPIIMARELGLFARYGLEVELKREISWSAVQSKVMDGALDAAHAPAAMPFAANLSCERPKDHCVTGLVLSLQGTAITLSRAVWEQAERSCDKLHEQILNSRRRRPYTFAAVFPYSSQHFLLRQWLKSIGVNPDTDVRIVMVPPDQMFPSLTLGYLDGYCAGEPWTSLAVEARVGWCVATSAELAPLHPEKVLMVRRDFAEKRAEEHGALIAALMEACAFCDQRSNRVHLSRTLADSRYVNAPASCLNAAFVGPFEFGDERREPLGDFVLFSRFNTNEPTADKALWIAGRLAEMGAITDPLLLQNPAISRVFRADIFHKANRLLIGQANQIQSEIKQYEDQFTSSGLKAAG